MRAKLVLLLLLASLALVAFATPSASAVGTCTGATNAIKDPDCPYMFCYGTYTDQYGRLRCQTYIPWPCQYCVPQDPQKARSGCPHLSSPDHFWCGSWAPTPLRYKGRRPRRTPKVC